MQTEVAINGSKSTRASGVEASYALSSLQQGMLFHQLLAPGSGVDVEQMVCTLHEEINVDLLRRAWEKVMSRHAILRTRFRWEGLEQPVQEVLASVPVPFEIADWRDLSAAQQNEKLMAFLKADRRRGLEMNEAPLLRLALFQRGDCEWTLVWTFHHALLDGRSFPIVLKEVFAFYEAEQRSETINLPLPRPYRDYIAWLETLDLGRAEKFWREALKNFTSATPLIVDHPAVELDGASRQGDRKVFLTEEATARLESLAKENGFTLNTFIQGAWALLLHRYNGEEDVVFGATRACRRSSISGAEDMVGLFINTLPVRARVSQESRVLDWMRELRGQWTAMRDFEHTPLAQVQNWSSIESGKPLFESILVFENYLLNTTLRAQGGDWAKREFRLYEQTNFPLTVTVYGGTQLYLQIEFDRSRFDDTTILRMLGHFRTLLESMAANPQQRLADLPLLAEGEQDQITGWNATHRDYPEGVLLHQLFEAQVAKTPDAIALCFEQVELTYRELDSRANRLANHLRGLGIKPDQLVGVCMERSIEMVVALYGIVKAGGAYVPIDPEYPADRVAFMIGDAGVSVLLTQNHLVAQLPPHSAKVICLDSDWEMISRESDAKPNDEISAGNLAYMIYTSGSTGKPKGAMNTHRGICNRLLWMQEQYQIGSADVVLQKTPFSFDVSVWEFFWPLLTGAQLVVAKPGGHKDAAYLVKFICERKVTTLHFVPPMLRVFLDEPGVEQCRSLRHVVCSGEALPFDLQEKLFEKLSAQLHNLYGPTEAAVDVTHWTCQRNGDLRIVPIGKPVANTQCHVLDSRLRSVPVGVPGELHLGGVQIGRGYHNRPELTAEKFISDPFRRDINARLYKTGDLCRYLPDGNIEYLGRLDHQVKIRGFRIELGEIEARLAEHPAIKENVVVARQDGGEKRLVAYLVAKTAAPAVADLREHLLKSLPDFMVPSAFVWLDALPLSPNGKVDRKVLPAPEAHRSAAVRYLAPRNAVEEILAKAWAAVLRLEKVGIEDNFFELGGDSILMIQIIARTRAAGLALTPKLIFKHPTIAELAAAVPKAEMPLSEQGLVTGSVPLTPVQQWFFELNTPEPHHWNQAFLFRTRERLDVDLLAKAVEKIEQHHDALRLRFKRVAGGWEQLHAPSAAAAFQVVRCAADDLKRIEQICEATQSSLNLENGPVFKVIYFDLGVAGEGRLLIVIHHLVVDGISWRVLLEDLESAYEQLRTGGVVRLPAKTASFQQWSRALCSYAESETVRNTLNYWRDVPAANLPKEGSGENTEGRTRTMTVSLNTHETQELLQSVPAAFNSQINDALITALTQAVSAWSGQGGVTIDLEGHGREDIAKGVDVSRTVGWFTSVFPVHIELAANASSVDALKQVKEQIRAVPARGIGYGALRYLAGDPELRARRQPEIVFNYFGQFDRVVADSKLFEFASESSGRWRADSAPRRYSWEINALVTGGKLEVRWTYSPSHHRDETIKQVADSFIGNLKTLIQASTQSDSRAVTPSDFPLAALDQVALDKLAASYGRLEDIFPLSPVQRLFHALESAGNAIGFDQYHYTLRGDLDARAFRTAWEKVLQRHMALRTAFVSEGLMQSLQVVQAAVELPWREEDWRAIAPADRDRKFSEFLESDRKLSFDISKAPLMRCSLFRIADQEWRFIWSHHHLQVDGWSWPLIFREVAEFYRDAACAAKPIRPFSDYISWLNERCTRGEEEFWRDNLRGFTEPTRLPVRSVANGCSGFKEETVKLTNIETASIGQVVRSNQVTLSALTQAAWAAVLSRHSGRDDVLFGAAFSGRPADMVDVEAMVGSFVNNVAVRMHVTKNQTLRDWLQDVQTQLAQLNTHQFSSPLQVQEWSELPQRYRLFESLVVFQNYAVDDSAWRLGDVTIDDFVAPVRTNFPLTLLVNPGPQLSLTLIYDARLADKEQAATILQDVVLVLRGFANDVRRSVAEVLGTLSAPSAELPAPRFRATSQHYIAPQTELEKAIAAIWQKAFGLERVGVADNFFDLGGHSLLMVRVHAQLCAALGKDISIVRMFQYPTVGALAKHLGLAPVAESFEKVQTRAQLQRAALARQRMTARRNV